MTENMRLTEIIESQTRAAQKANELKEFELQVRTRHIQALQRNNEIKEEYNHRYLQELRKSNSMEQENARLTLVLKEKELEMKERELILREAFLEVERNKVSSMQKSLWSKMDE